ncbi:MAG: cupin domain-containing protein [Gammaproteobacteria bacterium]|jgi:quercetin dioxygenase-like cupin family protein|nr:cupin [Gammaproteobacteria bacterium]MDP6096508.1 cupin domain-containing protein [Gammaproteobacteria bacterium]|tara:strand:- start:545 stop:883 length:339 start_codon:yes stop_codon:yes gene_type:complete
MSFKTYYPELIRALPEYEGRFEARKLEAKDCDVLFASYPAGTKIESHTHPTENIGVITKGALLLTMDGNTQLFATGDWYHVPAGKEHAAEFTTDTAEIEFWFTLKADGQDFD